MASVKISSILTEGVVEDDRKNHTSLFPDWKNCLAEWPLMHRNAMLTGKQLVARTESSFIASPLSLCMHHSVLTHTHTSIILYVVLYVFLLAWRTQHTSYAMNQQ